jgi:hypothetical protein
MDEGRKIEGEYGGQKRTKWIPWKGGVKQSHIHHQLCAVGGEKAPAGSTVLNWVQSFNSDNETAKATVRELYCSTHKIVS